MALSSLLPLFLSAKGDIRRFLFLIFALLILLPAAFFFLHPKPTNASWYSDSWKFRKLITINHAKVPATQIDFPVLVKITDPNLKTFARQDGFDILFTLASNSAKLSHEIETYASASGTLTAWAKIPTISSNVDTPLYMYYGNASSTNQQDKTNVWSNGYAMVQHLADGNTLSTFCRSRGV